MAKNQRPAPTEGHAESRMGETRSRTGDTTRDDARASRLRDDDIETLRAKAVWFDGQSSLRRRVRLRLSGRSLRFVPDVDPHEAAAVADTPTMRRVGAPQPANDVRHRLEDLRVGERWKGAPLAVALPDGGTLWIEDDAGGAAGALSQALVTRVSRARWRARKALPLPRAARLVESWPAVVACLLATLALLAWFDRRGAALVATTALKVVPTSLDRRIGDAAWEPISREWLTKTEVSEIRQLRVRQRFREVAAQVAPDTAVDLRFHRMRGSMRFTGRGGGGEGKRGDNHDIDEDDDDVEDNDPARTAAATSATGASGGSGASGASGSAGQASGTNPGGTKRRDRRNGDGGFNAFAMPNGTIVVLDGLVDRLNDDELMAVLGHELGHVVHRHSMRGVMRSASLLAAAGVVFGDFSSVVASSVASLQSLHYSRDDEREADTFGRRFAEAAKLPAGTEARVWHKFMKEEKRMGAQGIPAWLSSHPSSEERLKAAETAQ